MVTVGDMVEILAWTICQLEPEEERSDRASAQRERQLSATEAAEYYGPLERALADHLITERQCNALRHVIHNWEAVDPIVRTVSEQLLGLVRQLYG